MKRILCLYFPRWPVQRYRQDCPEAIGRALALTVRVRRGVQISSCSPEANRLGVRRGMSRADALALAPGLHLAEADPHADLAALQRLARWAERFSPLVALDLVQWPQSLLLDVSGCARVFKGEGALLRQALEGIRKKGLRARGVIAPTPAAAWALTHGGRSALVEPESLRTAIESLPLACLRLDGALRAALEQLGVRTLGELARQPRSTLPARFGTVLGERLARLFGESPDPLPLLRPEPAAYAGMAFEYGVKELEPLLAEVERLAVRVAAQLRRRGHGAREVECWLFHETEDPACATVSFFQPCAESAHLFQLLRTRLEDHARGVLASFTRAHGGEPGLQVESVAGICAAALRVTLSEPLTPEQLEFFSRPPAGGSLALTLERLGTRLGADAVLRARLAEDAQPECACRFVPLRDDVPAPMPPMPPPPVAPRPLKLLPRPEAVRVDWPDGAATPRAFEHNGQTLALLAACGPERIETGWWRASYVRRDYFVMEDSSGRQYWLFRDLAAGTWFLHGVFD